MKTLLVIISMVTASIAFAGPGHDHHHGHHHTPADTCKKIATKELKSSSEKIGKCHIERFIKAGKIDSSWKDALYEKSVLKEFKGKSEWVVTFDNQNGKKGKKLYIFLEENGGFVAANFSGK